MLKQVLSSMMLLTVSCTILSGCTKEDVPKITDTTFTLTFKDYPTELSGTGFFTATGDPSTAGNFTMDFQLVGKDSLHCSQTLTVPTVGSITIISDCSMTTNTGSWYVTESTGAYANLEGSGSLIMSPPTETSPEVEALYGKTWRN